MHIYYQKMLVLLPVGEITQINPFIFWKSENLILGGFLPKANAMLQLFSYIWRNLQTIIIIFIIHNKIKLGYYGLVRLIRLIKLGWLDKFC